MLFVAIHHNIFLQFANTHIKEKNRIKNKLSLVYKKVDIEFHNNY